MDGSPSWVVIVSTALSGLGSTLSGLHNLYGLSTHVTAAGSSPPMIASSGAASDSMLPAVAAAGGITSGALALLTAKLGTVGGTLSISALGSMVGGCICASMGAVYFAYSIVRLNTFKPPHHAPVEGSPEAQVEG